MSDADYIVLRAAPDLPPGFMPPEMDGRWYDRAGMVPVVPHPPGSNRAVAVPTGRFETRDDGAVAEVWEFQV